MTTRPIREPGPAPFLAWAALIACAAALAGCARRAEPPALVVASVRQPATALFFVAQGAGCFAAERLRVEDRTHELGRDALARLRDGEADVAIAYETPLLRAALVDDRLRVLTKLHTSTRNTRLVARTAARIGAFSDLRGRKLALARGTNAEFFAELAVTLGAIPRSAVEVVDLAPPAAVAALARGDVDAAVLSDPFAGEAEQLLGAGGLTLATDAYVETSLLITRTDVLAARRPSLLALVRGLACAERYARDRLPAAQGLIRSRFPDQPASALERQLARVTWGIGIDHVLVDLLRRERDWLVATSPGSRAGDLRPLLDERILEEVAPEAVTLLPAPRGLRW